MSTQYTKSVRDIPVLFYVGYVEVYSVTHFDTFDVVRREVATDTSHIYVYIVTISYHFSVSIGTSYVRVVVILKWINFSLLIFDF